ncbi:hypothetical protein LXL04_016598 [Taraxacum kok-saghyz]
MKEEKIRKVAMSIAIVIDQGVVKEKMATLGIYKYESFNRQIWTKTTYDETVEHLFLRCSTAKELIAKLNSWWNVLPDLEDIQHIDELIFKGVGGSDCSKYAAVTRAFMWLLWMHRNDVCFKGKGKPVAMLATGYPVPIPKPRSNGTCGIGIEWLSSSQAPKFNCMPETPFFPPSPTSLSKALWKTQTRPETLNLLSGNVASFRSRSCKSAMAASFGAKTLPTSSSYSAAAHGSFDLSTRFPPKPSLKPDQLRDCVFRSGFSPSHNYIFRSEIQVRDDMPNLNTRYSVVG